MPKLFPFTSNFPQNSTFLCPPSLPGATWLRDGHLSQHAQAQCQASLPATCSLQPPTWSTTTSLFILTLPVSSTPRGQILPPPPSQQMQNRTTSTSPVATTLEFCQSFPTTPPASALGPLSLAQWRTWSCTAAAPPPASMLPSDLHLSPSLQHRGLLTISRTFQAYSPLPRLYLLLPEPGQPFSQICMAHSLPSFVRSLA